ncbi:MAG: hypothetical protein QM571_02255 [Micrococcaceae bacterium]
MMDLYNALNDYFINPSEVTEGVAKDALLLEVCDFDVGISKEQWKSTVILGKHENHINIIINYDIYPIRNDSLVILQSWYQQLQDINHKVDGLNAALDTRGYPFNIDISLSMRVDLFEEDVAFSVGGIPAFNMSLTTQKSITFVSTLIDNYSSYELKQKPKPLSEEREREIADLILEKISYGEIIRFLEAKKLKLETGEYIDGYIIEVTLLDNCIYEVSDLLTHYKTVIEISNAYELTEQYPFIGVEFIKPTNSETYVDIFSKPNQENIDELDKSLLSFELTELEQLEKLDSSMLESD